MDGPSAKKSTSLETLVIQNITNVNELKAKLNDIIQIGKDYEYDISSCLKSLVHNNDQEIALLSIQAVSELAKCEAKRESYAQNDIINPILAILKRDLNTENKEVVKQSCRALGNLCCDCDAARKVILDSEGVFILINLFRNILNSNIDSYEEIKLLLSKTLLNFAIGGNQFSEAIVKEGFIKLLHKIMVLELESEDINDDMMSTCLLIMSVINDNTPEFLYEEQVNVTVLSVLKETTNIEISELCLEHLHNQAEHDSVKTLLASLGGVQLVCARLEQLISRHCAGELNADDTEVETVMRLACDLLIIVLTGDEAMHMLYNKGVGEVYLTMIKWLNSTNYNLLTTAILAVGNFARQDDYCVQMMQDNIFDKLLDLFETYHGFEIQIQKEPDKKHPIESATVTKFQHALLSALRNLVVPPENKRVAAAKGRAGPIMISALPHVKDPHVAYKLLAVLRMLVDGQESVARLLGADPSTLTHIASWGLAGQFGGAAGEAPRLLAWTARRLVPPAAILWGENCISCLVNMLMASHSVMQNEAILALTLIAIDSLNTKSESYKADTKNSFVSQLIKSEIGKHLSVLIETNCAKMPTEVAENLLAFLDITTKKNKLCSDYKEVKLQDSLQKFMDARKDFSDDLKSCIVSVISAIASSERSD